MWRYSFILAWLVCSIFFSGGCANSRPEPVENTAVRAAKAAVAAQLGWKKMEVVYSRFEQGRWVVMIARKPGMPGGHVVLELTEEGKVLRWRPGS